MESLKNHIANFVRYKRRQEGLTQQQLAGRAGVGLRFIRDLEQGKESLRLDKVKQVLTLFGYEIGPVNTKDAYEILLNHFNKPVHVYLKNRKVLIGAFVEALNSGPEIDAWRFLPNDKAKEFDKTKNEDLKETIQHADIDGVENIL